MAKAAVTRSIRDDHQKNFLKLFNSLTGKHSRWEIWEDFVTLTAIEISNSTDKVNAPERTKTYQTIISKYSSKEREGMAEMLGEVIMGMEQNPDQDFLGSLYMMCELGNSHAGQFFTPYDVCRCMAEITFDPKLHPDMEGFISVSDPACGAGATLLAFLNVCKRRNICYHNKVLVIAQDIDFIVGLMCYIQCSFMGCAGYVVIGDTLVNPATAYDSRGLLPAGPQNRIWYMPLFSTDVWYMRRQIAQMNLLELNHDSFKKAEKRGATLSDFAQLDKIEDLEARNRVLETLGTQNFNRAMQDALEQQKWQHQKAEWIEQLKKFAVEDPQATYQTHEHVNAYGKWGTKKEVIMPEDADKVAYVYKVSENQIDLYKPRDTEAEDASNSAREAARATEQLAREQFAAVTKLMYELRWDFVKDLTPAECRKHLPEILAYSTPILTEYRHMEDDENVLRLLGIGLDEQIREDTELEDALKMFNAYDTEPEKILLAVAFDATDGIHEGYWSTEWNGPTGASKFVHRKNDDLDSTYELLTALGYEMADDEKALQDGTHQLFAVYGSGSKADTPCDKCKAAHPECDKCCKTCDDHCNAFQLCRKEYGE